MGYPGVPDHVSLWGLLIPTAPGDAPVGEPPAGAAHAGGPQPPGRDRGPEDIDFVVVRENSEGEYSELGGRSDEGTDDERVEQVSVFTRRGVDRILRYAFELARTRPDRHVTSATKSNGIIHTMPYWDERFRAVATEYPDVRADQYHVDILAANFVLHPDWFDVVVGSNLFGDILSDLGPAVAGHHRHRAFGQHQPRGRVPVHVRARPRLRPGHRRQGDRQPHRPDLVRRPHARAPGGGRRRPGRWSGPSRRWCAVPKLLTRDMGGSATTRELGEALAEVIREV